MALKQLHDFKLANTTVLLRLDLNVPLDDQGRIEDDSRLQRVLPTIHALLDAGAGIIILSHLGRPKAGIYDPVYSLKPIAKRLTALLKHPVQFAPSLDVLEQIVCQPGQCILAENVRFNDGETENDPALAQRYAALADVYINDAFATAHRAHASTAGVAAMMPKSGVGLLMAEELDFVMPLMLNAAKPLAAIVGGSKVSTKLNLLKKLVEKVDILILGGGIANTFLLAQGYAVGQSLCEPELIDTAKDILLNALKHNTIIALPKDVVVLDQFAKDAVPDIVSIDAVPPQSFIVDVGPNTSAYYTDCLEEAKTIIWNGPIGIFEWPNAEAGTKALAQVIARSDAQTIAGGGDTLAVIKRYNLADQLTYLSTGGGAFLALLEGQTLPALQALEATTF